MDENKKEESITYNDIVRSEKPLNWRAMLKELSFTSKELNSVEKTMIPSWGKVKRLLNG